MRRNKNQQKWTLADIERLSKFVAEPLIVVYDPRRAQKEANFYRKTESFKINDRPI